MVTFIMMKVAMSGKRTRTHAEKNLTD